MFKGTHVHAALFPQILLGGLSVSVLSNRTSQPLQSKASQENPPPKRTQRRRMSLCRRCNVTLQIHTPPANHTPHSPGVFSSREGRKKKKRGRRSPRPASTSHSGRRLWRGSHRRCRNGSCLGGRRRVWARGRGRGCVCVGLGMCTPRRTTRGLLPWHYFLIYREISFLFRCGVPGLL